jgi:AcrR family transcriptional regulator
MAKPAQPEAISDAQRIVAGARAHFFAHGFRSVTMSDLAAELGMSKKTLYAHFPSKAALLSAVITNKLVRVEHDLAAVMSRDASTFAQRLQRLLAALRGQMDEIQPAFVRDVRRENPELFARIQGERRQLIHRFFGGLLEEGRKAGMIRKDIPVKLLIEILVGSVDAVLVPARVEELGLSVKTGFAQIIAVFLEGALVRKGGAK